VREAAAGPANVRHVQLLQRRHDIVADTSRVRNVRARTDPYTFIDPSPEMLGELSEDLAADLRTCLICLYGENQGVLRMNRAHGRQEGAQRERRQSRLQHSDLRQESAG